jgi:hypothetical protein
MDPKTLQDLAIVRAPDGRIVLKLYDQGLSSELEAVKTIAHELNHVRGYFSVGEFTSEASATAAETAAGKFFK